MLAAGNLNVTQHGNIVNLFLALPLLPGHKFREGFDLAVRVTDDLGDAELLRLTSYFRIVVAE